MPRKNLYSRLKSGMYYAQPNQIQQLSDRRNSFMKSLEDVGYKYRTMNDLIREEERKQKELGTSYTPDKTLEMYKANPLLQIFDAIAMTNKDYIVNMKLPGLDTELKKPDPFGVILDDTNIKRSLGVIPEEIINEPTVKGGEYMVKSKKSPVDAILNNSIVIDDDVGRALPGKFMDRPIKTLNRKKIEKKSAKKIKKYKKRLMNL